MQETCLNGRLVGKSADQGKPHDVFSNNLEKLGSEIPTNTRLIVSYARVREYILIILLDVYVRRPPVVSRLG